MAHPHDASGYRELEPDALSLADRYQTLLGGVSPRPIAFVGSMSGKGKANLSPYSFFTAVSSTPPFLVFSPALDGKTGKRKDTLVNILETGEFTVSIVTSAMAEQMNMTSFEYAHGTDEFVVSGLTKLASRRVGPPGVAESPFIMECRLHRHIPLGDRPGSGNLVIGEVLLFRVRHGVYNRQGRIDPEKMDQLGRMGFSWYTRARKGIFRMKRPGQACIGHSALPVHVRESTVLTGNDLGRLASVPQRPDTRAWSKEFKDRFDNLALSEIHYQIKAFLEEGEIEKAWALVDMVENRVR